ncbi:MULTISPECIES: hypothetical protein [Microbacterium]|uniref:hypothetical protein n=1 Tax=Microbacterium TaxID=33882 RepID=UPI000D65A439|nr:MULTISPECIES: hypothetical protein [Microbacterium]
MDINTIDAENAAMIEALVFCKTAGDNRWLVDLDPWIAQSMITATTDLGFSPVPDPSRAIAVESNSTSTTDPDAGDSLILGRKWRYASELNGKPVAGLDSTDNLPMASCHRCDSLDVFERKRAQATFYIPRGRFVVEFALCRDCMIHLASLASHVTERSRVESGDTYVEFERSARVGEDDTEV